MRDVSFRSKSIVRGDEHCWSSVCVCMIGAKLVVFKNSRTKLTKLIVEFKTKICKTCEAQAQ